MTVRKMAVKKIIVLKNDRFNQTTIIKYDCKKNVRMEKKMFEKSNSKKIQYTIREKRGVHLLYIKPMYC
jgi:glycogen debranching enzyme